MSEEYEIKTAGDVLKEKHQVKVIRKYKEGLLYNTKRWQRFSKYFRSKNPWCEVETCNNFADDVDHIKPLEEGGAEFDERNLMSLCKSCHAIKSAKDRILYKK